MKVAINSGLKILFLSISIAIQIGHAFAQSKKPPYSQIAGSLSTVTEGSLKLRSYGSNERRIEVKAGKFEKKLDIDTGCYYTLDKHILYLEPGFNLKIAIKDSIITFQGKGSIENQIFSNLDLLIRKYVPFDGDIISTKINDILPNDFIKSINTYEADARAILKNERISNLFRKTQTSNIENLARYYLKYYDDNYGIDPIKRKEFLLIADNNRKGITKISPTELLKLGNDTRIKKMSLADHQQVLKLIWDDFDLNNGNLYQLSPSYRNLVEKRLATLTKAASLLPSSGSKQDLEIRMETAEKNITNKSIKEDILYNITVQLLKYRVQNLDDIYNNYVNKAIDSGNLAFVRKLYNSIQNTKDMIQSPDFEFEDVTSNRVQLKSFANKYVYLDLWATWCAPCIAELPSLKNLFEKYKNQNIKFVGISIDKKEDLEKWKNFVLKNKVPGVQLIASKESDFIKSFNIYSIPRYILLAPNGMIIMENAPPPSNKELMEILDRLLIVN